MTARLISAALCALFAGCYETPGDPDGVIEVAVNPATQGASLMADGRSEAAIRVTVHPQADADKAISVTVSSGRVNFAADPGSDEARSKSQSNPGDGVVEFPWEMGTVAGNAIVTAAIDQFEAATVVALDRSRPDDLFLAPDVTTATADGTSSVEVRTFLVTDDDRKVSIGTRVRYRVCCEGRDSGSRAECTGPPPLRLVPLAEFDGATGDVLTVTASVERLTDAEFPAPVLAWIVARADDGDTPAIACLDPVDEPGRDATRLTLLPIAATVR